MKSATKLNSDSLICVECIGDSNLKRRIKKEGSKGTCGHCGEPGITLTIERLADIVDKAFRNFYEPGDDEVEYEPESDHSTTVQAGDPLADIIAELIEADSEIVEALIDELSYQEGFVDGHHGGFGFYDSDTNYVESDLNTHEHYQVWREFQRWINHGRRFYDSENGNKLGQIFAGIEEFSLAGAISPVRTIDVTKERFEIVRARRAGSLSKARRVFQDIPKELGPPPFKSATAGRMNPAGISVFYGGLDLETCVAELRPPVGSLVVHASFCMEENIKVLDLSVFSKQIGQLDLFDKSVYEPLKRWRFLQSFHTQISRPVQPEDEPLEYVATQAVAEYLRNVLKFDGIIYSSPQTGTGKKNIVLFNMHVPLPNKKVESDDEFADQNPHLDEEERASFGSRPILKYVEGTVKVVRIIGAEYRSQEVRRSDLSFPF